MKKLAAGMAVLAAAGFTGLSMAPASAQMFQNCTQANNAGLYNIPVTSPAYSPDLDGNNDGVACEGDISFDPTRVPGYVAPVTPPVVSEPTSTAGFDNCTEARAAGAVNIPVGDPRYATHLDRDLDGIACEESGDDEVQTEVIVDYVPESWNTGADQYTQMGQVPAGAADTGVAVENGSTAGGLVLGGGTALAAAAGAALVLRRRSAVRS